MKKEELIAQAILARKKSYSPYSHFRVGAAIETDDGRVYTGCNIENASYSATNCAERTAIFKAISEDACHFRQIAIVGGKKDEPEDFCSPCGICRQVMCEFCDNDFLVILAKNEKEYQEYTLSQLFPMGFSMESK
jgi:cytidine deaminase